MIRIHKMSSHLSNKIAAGEVIESPSSVVKELIENSIDAKSTEIVITIKDAGKELIKVSDNGSGIHEDDISLIFERHATSKIIHEEDIEHIESLGFRGEALASIAAVSKVEMLSKQVSSTFGFKINIIKGNLFSQEKISSSNGTTISIEDLFFNIPARKKFLKSNSSEIKNINHIVYNLAIANPNIRFNYTVDDKLLMQTKGNNQINDVLYNIYGKELFNHLLEFRLENDMVKISGVTTDLNYYRGNKQLQSFFINNRYVQNSTLIDAVNEAYKALIPIHKFPVFFIKIIIKSEQVDVNIHPNKLIVKIEDEQKIANFLQKNLRDKLYKKDINTIYEVKEFKESCFKEEYNEPVKKIDNKNFIQSNIFDNFSRKDKISINKEIKDSYDMNIIEKSQEIDDRKYEIYENLHYIGQILKTYLIFEKNQDMYLLDQHAAHEKVLYEKFMNNYHQNNLDSQILLSPEILQVSKDDIEIIEINHDKFDKFGYDLEIFGTKEIVVRSIPSIFNFKQAKDMLLTLIDNYHSKEFLLNDLTEDDIIQKSCKHAIKAHDSLFNIEAYHLLEQLKRLNDPLTCPHGRPIIIKVAQRELEKMFNRIQV
ncbi:MAG: DNA mismatch repair endonuclease MutL [Clostridiales bacterium]|nr:DNA mismatch repair endonuclease MutL [Clostridiales bacterium]